MGRIVIVEGIDRIGKTTFVNKLIDAGFKPVFDRMEPKSDCSKEVNAAKMRSIMTCLKIFRESTVDIVIDRYHLTEFVYGKLNRGYDNLEAVKQIETELKALRAVCIFIYPSNNLKLLKCSDEHGSDLQPHQELFEEYLYNHARPELWTWIDENDLVMYASLVIERKDD